MDITARQLIDSFHDTLRIASEGRLGEETKLVADNTKIYYEGFETKSRPHNPEWEGTWVQVCLNTTLTEARKYVKEGRVAVLSFSNPHYPGGGVNNGARAQEQCLCRSTNLYPCLCTDFARINFYDYHRANTDHFFSDRLIYTRNVTVFKDDQPIPALLPEEEWFHVDVITCTAPYLDPDKFVNPDVLDEMLRKRFKVIFEAAIENHVTCIILGAIGCGAFHNPPQAVANAFKAVISENQYHKSFKRIIFAIKEANALSMETYKAFSDAFPSFLFNSWDESYAMPQIDLPSGNFIPSFKLNLIEPHHFGGSYRYDELKEMMVNDNQVIGNNRAEREYQEQRRYFIFQKNNPLYGKKVSVLGDSISTLNGYQPNNYQVFYEGENCIRSRVQAMEHTWWGHVINLLGAELLVNDSWSGARVTRLPNYAQVFPSGCSDERTGRLHSIEKLPDVIMIYMGMNDWANAVPLGLFQENNATDPTTMFYSAYTLMLNKLRNNYPNAVIYCCTLNATMMSQNPAFQFPFSFGGIRLDEYNDLIRQAAGSCQCLVLDLEKYHMPYDSIDGSHPNAEGMKTLAMLILRELLGENAGIFDCPSNLHEYMKVSDNGYQEKYVCRKCCKLVSNVDSVYSEEHLISD